MANNRFEYAVAYFMEKLNIGENQARGIVGNLVGESNLDATARGDYSYGQPSAFGIAQWHAPRAQAIYKATGIDVMTASFEDQIVAVAWEFQNTEKNAFNKLLKTKTIEDATYAVMKWFERPANDSSLAKRVEAAKGNGAGVSDDSTFGSKVADALTPTWVSDLLTGHTAARWSTVIIGILFIGLAVAAFVLKSDVVSDVVKEAL